MLTARRPEEVRRAPRQDVCYRSELIGEPFGNVPALIVNVSAIGCMLRCLQPIAPGSEISVDFPIVGRQHGRVVWAMGGRVGIELDDMIPDQGYFAMLEKMQRPGDAMEFY